MKIIDDLKKWWTAYWAAHGTKIIGFGTAALGALEYVDHSTIQLIETTFGPKTGPLISHVIMVTSGLATAYRGFTNSQKAAAPTVQPPPQA